jgi:hypothetical protein
MPAASSSKASKTAYSPVLRRERKDEAGTEAGRSQSGTNPFEPTACCGRSIIFWVLAATLVSVIVAVILTISFVLTSYKFGGQEDRYFVSVLEIQSKLAYVRM